MTKMFGVAGGKPESRARMNKNKFLVCIDSDGCAIDSMDIKHEQCFGPAFIEVWPLEKKWSAALKRWNQINLFSAMRGINRFKGLGIMLGELNLENPVDLDEFIHWTEEASELSNQALEVLCKNNRNPVFMKALKWSRLVNERIEQLPVPRPFQGVRECMAEIQKNAALAAVSSANREAILLEWKNGGLMEYVDYVFSQSDGSKKECLERLIGMGYDADHILMVGDAPGDYLAAKSNGIWFYPILAGKEMESWEKLKETYFNLFIGQKFQELENYQEAASKKMMS